MMLLLNSENLAPQHHREQGKGEHESRYPRTGGVG
jgi:hypothetical protein